MDPRNDWGMFELAVAGAVVMFLISLFAALR